MKRKKIRIALSGDRGRMGKSLKRLIKRDSSKEVVAGANRKVSPDSWSPKKIDAVIDFSLPPLFLQTLKWCETHKKIFVSGTTGLNSQQKSRLKLASKKIPCFYSENMSWGIFVLAKYLSQIGDDSLQVLLEDYHHKDKKDIPSGTALRLRNHLPARLKKICRIKSYRKGLEFGTHRIKLMAPEEELILEHRALSRDVFSKGALKALEFVCSKKKGLYSLEDIYG